MPDKYLPFRAITEMMPFRSPTAGLKAGFEADPCAWEARPLPAEHVRRHFRSMVPMQI